MTVFTYIRMVLSHWAMCLSFFQPGEWASM
jgi:hypothetical protein